MAILEAHEAHKAPPLRWRALSTALAMLLAAVVILPLLGHRLLVDWDEGIYAEVSREMAGNGWLVPLWNYQPWLEKPPLMLWTTAAFFRLFGVSEFWARAGSAFSGVAVVGVTHLWLLRRGSRSAAWIATLLLLMSFGFLHVCRVGEMDVMLTLGAVIALVGLASVDGDSGDDSARGSAAGWYLFWAGFAVALMTKGAASVTLLLTALIAALVGRWRRTLLTRPFWIGLAVALAVVLPWHVAMVHRFGKSFLNEYLGFHTIARATTQIEGHRTHWWFYLWVLLVSAAPFILLAPVAIATALRRTGLRGHTGLRIWAIFAVVEIVFFSTVQTRIPHYIAPVYPALAVVTAVWLAERLRLFAERRDWTPQKLWLYAGAAGLAAWALGALATAAPRLQLHAERANGRITHEEKEALLLLRQAFAHPEPAGPVLVWRESDPRSITDVLFYTHRPAQQVELEPLPPSVLRDKYDLEPLPLEQMVGPEPRFMLMERSLLTRLPAGMVFTPIAEGGQMIVGTIRRVPASR